MPPASFSPTCAAFPVRAADEAPAAALLRVTTAGTFRAGRSEMEGERDRRALRSVARPNAVVAERNLAPLSLRRTNELRICLNRES
jgi:hypothetical protein